MGTGGRARSACLVGRWGRGLEDCIALYSISLRILGKGEREGVTGLDGLDGRLASLGLRLGLGLGLGCSMETDIGLRVRSCQPRATRLKESFEGCRSGLLSLSVNSVG